MRFYDVSSSIDRRRALNDLMWGENNTNNNNTNPSNTTPVSVNNVKNVWVKLPHAWRRDKEFILTVLRVTAPPLPPSPPPSSSRSASASSSSSVVVVEETEHTNQEDDDNLINDGSVSLGGEQQQQHHDGYNNNNNNNNNTSTDPSTSTSTRNKNRNKNRNQNRNQNRMKYKLPSKSEFERLFPQSLRLDREIVLAWVRRSDFPHLFKTRHLFLPPCLSMDKEVCVAYCQQIPRSLQDCHVDLCDDSDVVSAAITHCGGLELQYASHRLQCLESMVRKACTYNGSALLFCPSICDAFRKITQDRSFMFHVVLGGGDDSDSDGDDTDGDGDGDGDGSEEDGVLTVLKDTTMSSPKRKRRRRRRTGRGNGASSGSGSGGAGMMWKLIDKTIQHTDEHLALQALRNGLSLRDVPPHFVSIAFLKRALKNNSSVLYLDLSARWQCHPELAVEAIIAQDSTPDVHAKAYALLSQNNNQNNNKDSASENHTNTSDDVSHYLRSNRDVILAVCDRGTVKLLRELIGEPVDIPVVNEDHQQVNALHNMNQFLQLMRVAQGAAQVNNNANANANNVAGNNNAAAAAAAAVVNNNNNNNAADDDANVNLEAEAEVVNARMEMLEAAEAMAMAHPNAHANANANPVEEVMMRARRPRFRFPLAPVPPIPPPPPPEEQARQEEVRRQQQEQQEIQQQRQLAQQQHQEQQRQQELRRQQQRPPSPFLDDFDLMQVAVARDPKLFGNVSPRLKDKLEIILASIADGPSAWIRLKHISWEVQRQHPAITIKCLQLVNAKNLRYLPNYIPNDVWTANRELRVAWIRRKGNVLPCFLPGITTDETLALEVAKHTWKQFHKVGEAFLNNKQFVIKALKLDGRCIKHVTSRLQTDYEVLTVAVANYYNRYDDEMAVAIAADDAARRRNKKNNPEEEEDESSLKETTPLIIASLPLAFRGFCDIPQLQEIIHQKLRLYDFYLLSFLRGIAISSPRERPPALRSTLTMLDRGVETSEAFKRLIAEYLAVPVGTELTQIRQALVNINRPPPNGDPNNKASKAAKKDGSSGNGNGDNNTTQRSSSRTIATTRSTSSSSSNREHNRRDGDVIHRRLQQARRTNNNSNNNDDDTTTNDTHNREEVIGIFPLLVVANPPFVSDGRRLQRGIAPQAIRRRYVIRGVRGFGMEAGGQPERAMAAPPPAQAQAQAQAVQLLQPHLDLDRLDDDAPHDGFWDDDDDDDDDDDLFGGVPLLGRRAPHFGRVRRFN